RSHAVLSDRHDLTSSLVPWTVYASFLGGSSLSIVNILVPFLFAEVGTDTAYTAFGLSAGPLLTGIVLLPRALGQMFGGPATGPLSRLFGPAVGFAAGLVIQGIGTLGLALWRGSTGLVLLELGAIGLGFGVRISAAGSIVTFSASGVQTGSATALNSVVRRAAGAVG